MSRTCAICGAVRDLDRHHVVPRRMGGSQDPAVLGSDNLMVLCRSCHANVHEARWILAVDNHGLRVQDALTGEQLMRRLTDPTVDPPRLFQLLNLTVDSYTHVLEALPFLSDEELVEAFGYARNFGKRAWLVQAAILHEAQARSIYGDEALAAVARRFEIGLRQAQKYAMVWQTFFSAEAREEENVNIDAFALEEPSWYLVTASETKDPHAWLAYAQDRKLGDPRYNVAALRRDIRTARIQESIGQGREAQRLDETVDVDKWRCPWVRIVCTRSGRPVSTVECDSCDEQKPSYSKTKSISGDDQ
jgi:HNH endonuclease